MRYIMKIVCIRALKQIEAKLFKRQRHLEKRILTLEIINIGATSIKRVNENEIQHH